jgi:hypothetical protein
MPEAVVVVHVSIVRSMGQMICKMSLCDYPAEKEGSDGPEVNSATVNIITRKVESRPAGSFYGKFPLSGCFQKGEWRLLAG